MFCTSSPISSVKGPSLFIAFFILSPWFIFFFFIRVQYGELKGINIPEDQVPLAIDEFPVLFVAAACAEGLTVLTGAEELRVKESDRIQSMADGLVTLGIDAQSTPDGIRINGGQLGSGTPSL